MQQQKITLSQEAAKINAELTAKIIDEIGKSGGAIPFSDFMKMALYFPQLGYYQNSIHKFGKQGDFITSPELGSLFTQCFARALTWLKQEPLNILEIGAGSGAMASGILSALRTHGQLPERYFILEPSASLQSQQKDTLTQQIPELISKVVWLERLPQDFEGVIFANEVVDAIPCHRIKRCPDGWRQMDVGVDSESNASFGWRLGQQIEVDQLPRKLQAQDDFEQEYTTELRPQAAAWLAGVAQCLKRGHILLFDYGYGQNEFYHPQRVDGTLRCFSRHLAHSDPLQLVGLQDITAHADFTELAQVAVNHGLVVEGFTTQAGFLLENGLLEHVEETLDETQRFQTSQQIQKLVAPGQMGEIFKVLHLSRGAEGLLPGFSMQNHLGKL